VAPLVVDVGGGADVTAATGEVVVAGACVEGSVKF